MVIIRMILLQKVLLPCDVLPCCAAVFLPAPLQSMLSSAGNSSLPPAIRTGSLPATLCHAPPQRVGSSAFPHTMQTLGVCTLVKGHFFSSELGLSWFQEPSYWDAVSSRGMW